MRGLMQDRPLLLSTLMTHASVNHADTEVVSRESDGSIVRSTYRATAARIGQLANALRGLGLAPGDRVGTLAWNTHRHLELYFGTSGCGFVCHTINPRLYVEQIVYIVNHAADRVVFFDGGFLDLVRRIAPQCPRVERWVCMAPPEAVPTGQGSPSVDCYEAMLSGESPEFAWPQLDEHTAAALCYTSGTTGEPKGVLYSHRSSVVHALSLALPDSLCLSARDVMMPAASMFHVNAWGTPYAAVLTGATLVLPGQQLDPDNLHRLIESEAVTHSVGVPTIWLGLLQYLEQSGKTLSTLRRVLVGGSACPPALIAAYAERYGVEIVHAWGMSETSPIVTINQPKRKHAGLAGPERDHLRAAQGRVAAGLELKTVGADGQELPRDGTTTGDLMVRGWWVASRYFSRDEPILDAEGWFHTGDVATIDPDGFMRITDRSKDVIKSGGEWISSIELENLAVAHPSVAEAAVIGVRHPKWDERPLLIVRLKEGRALTRAEMTAFLTGKVAKWWLPDDMVVVDDIPHTATGKILKRQLREDFRGHVLPG